jgi:hypothetical protein
MAVKTVFCYNIHLVYGFELEKKREKEKVREQATERKERNYTLPHGRRLPSFERYNCVINENKNFSTFIFCLTLAQVREA